MTIEEVVLRPLRDHEIRVRVRACGVCHSDLSVLNELFACPTPVVLGHEASGVVEEVGRSVARMHVGDHVVASWSPACSDCRYCRRGKLHLCKLTDDPTGAASGLISLGNTPVAQFLGVGGFAEEIILSDNAAVVIDPSMPLDKASLLGCAVPRASARWRKRPEYAPATRSRCWDAAASGSISCRRRAASARARSAPSISTTGSSLSHAASALP